MIPSYLWVGAPDAPLLGFVLHGVLGAGHNFRSFIKRLTDERPNYAFVLIDLRNHGKSLDAPPPHTMETAADDLLDLAQHLGRDPDVVIGHSLGGKVALCFARRHVEPRDKRKPLPAAHQRLVQVWALDSDPGAQVAGSEHQVRRVMAALRSHPGPFGSRAEVIDRITSEGLSSGLAQWLATNLERKSEGFVWRLDLNAIDELLDDYFSLDLWSFLEDLAAGSPALQSPLPHIHLVVAQNSDRWSGTMKERALGLPTSEHFTLHELANSGHWVHVDNPDGLLAFFNEALPVVGDPKTLG